MAITGKDSLAEASAGVLLVGGGSPHVPSGAGAIGGSWAAGAVSEALSKQSILKFLGFPTKLTSGKGGGD